MYILLNLRILEPLSENLAVNMLVETSRLRSEVEWKETNKI